MHDIYPADHGLEKRVLDQACESKSANELCICAICRKVFEKRNSFEKHLVDHERDSEKVKNGDLKCKIGDTQLKTELLLENHEKDKNEFVCSICKKVFSTKVRLEAHVGTHNSVDEHEEHIANNDSFEERRGILICNICQYEVRGGIKGLNIHLANHERKKEENSSKHESDTEKKTNHGRICLLCTEGFCSDNYLKQHLRIVHSNEEENIQEVDLNNRPVYIEKPNCGLCDLTFECLRSLGKHMINEHNTKAKTGKKVDQGKNFDRIYMACFCSLCKKIFMDVTSLQKHVNWVHGTLDRQHRKKIEEDGEILNFGEGKTEFICLLCQEAFSDGECLQEHLENNHKESYGEECMCSLCDITFRSGLHLKMHEEIEHEVKKRSKRVCPVCGQQFFVFDNLKCHMTQKHDWGKELIDCPLCEERLENIRLKWHIDIVHRGKEQCKCAACGETFPSRYLLKIHESLHAAKSSFTCFLCDNSFETNYKLQLHYLFHTDISNEDLMTHGAWPFCKTCGQPVEERLMRKHESTHKVQKLHQCGDCDISFDTILKLEDHLTQHKGENPFPCSICTEQFKFSILLTDHLKTNHSNVTKAGKETICPVCDRQFFSPQYLMQHIESVHEKKKRYKCETCQRGFYFRLSRDRHIQRGACRFVKEYKCDKCGKEYRTQLQMYDHYRKRHADYFMETQTCSSCGKSFKGKQNLDVHVRVAHSAKGNFLCEKCGLTIKLKSDYENHVADHREKEVGVSLVCAECGASGFTTLQLKEHLNVHYKSKRHSCPYCGKSFVDARNLRNHISMHTQKYRYHCHICGGGYNRMYYLLIHERNCGTVDRSAPTATRRRFFCEKCGKTFKSAKHLDTHEKNYHTVIEPIPCSGCSERFGTRHSLEMHKKECALYEEKTRIRNDYLKGKEVKCKRCLRTLKTMYCLKRHLRNGSCQKDLYGRWRPLPQQPKLDMLYTSYVIRESGSSQVCVK